MLPTTPDNRFNPGYPVAERMLFEDKYKSPGGTTTHAGSPETTKRGRELEPITLAIATAKLPVTSPHARPPNTTAP